MNRHIAAAVMAAAFLATSNAAAQDEPGILLLPAEPTRWDAAGQVTWLGANKSDIGAQWDDWYNAAAGGVAGGYYFTPHLRTDIHAAFSTEGHIYGEERTPIPVPGQPFPIFRAREHYFQTATLGAGVSYQFFENQWVHPFVGAGLEVVHERHRSVVPQQFVPSREPFPVVLPAEAGVTQITWGARPFVTGGFKAYVSERTFIRTDLRTSFSTRGVAHVAWSTGIGVDL